MSFETTSYLQPYELYLQHVKVEEDVNNLVIEHSSVKRSNNPVAHRPYKVEW